jgi:hypothetical protein
MFPEPSSDTRIKGKLADQVEPTYKAFHLEKETPFREPSQGDNFFKDEVMEQGSEGFYGLVGPAGVNAVC